MNDADALAGGDLEVVEGQQGWLFLSRSGPLDCMRVYTDPEAMPEQTVQTWVRTLQQRRRYFAERGIVYQTFVAPDAHTVYRDLLPPGYRLAAQSPFQRIQAALDPLTQAQCVYPLGELLLGRRTEPTYQAVDSHWTDYGAYLAYRTSIYALRRELPGLHIVQPEDLDWTVRPTFGSLGALMNPERSLDVRVATLRAPKAALVTRRLNDQREAYLVLEQDAPHLPSAVVFRDSFMTHPAKFYAESFRRVVFCSSPNTILYDLVDAEQPDVVIHEMGERRLVQPPHEPSTEDFRATFADLMLEHTGAVQDQRKSRSLARLGRYAEALGASDDALALAAPNARSLVHRAGIHLALNNPLAAGEALRHAISLDPSDAAPRFLMGQVLGLQGRGTESAQAYAQAARLEPRYAVYWHLAISHSLAQGQLALAEELRVDAVAEHPTNADIANAASWVLAARGDVAGGVAEVARAHELEPNVVGHIKQLARLQIQAERWEDAATTLLAWFKANPDDPDLIVYERMVLSRSKSDPAQVASPTPEAVTASAIESEAASQ